MYGLAGFDDGVVVDPIEEVQSQLEGFLVLLILGLVLGVRVGCPSGTSTPAIVC